MTNGVYCCDPNCHGGPGSPCPECTEFCPNGFYGTYVDTKTDPEHCGGCNNHCDSGVSCLDGVCGCQPGTQKCPSGCVDLGADPYNCGGCAVVCTGGTCLDGACSCSDGKTPCANTCTDINHDPQNCGGCGVVCQGPCVAGQCTQAGAGGAGGALAGCLSTEGGQGEHGTWRQTAAPSFPYTTPVWHTSTLLDDGRVLVVGGANNANMFGSIWAFIYNPASDSWGDGILMPTRRGAHAAVKLLDGRVLVMGGEGEDTLEHKTLSSAEIFDPTTLSWAPTGSMNVARSAFEAVLVEGGPHAGKVLVAGGTTKGVLTNDDDGSTEIYDPATGQWMLLAATLPSPRRWFPPSHARSMPGGQVLLVGGTSAGVSWFDEPLRYDPLADVWQPTSSKQTKAQGALTRLADGRAMVTGGKNGVEPGESYLASAELFDDTTGTWMGVASMAIARHLHTLTTLCDGRVLAVGGVRNGEAPAQPVAEAEFYDPATGAWSTSGAMKWPRYRHTATRLLNGQVLVVGGTAETGISLGELYTP